MIKASQGYTGKYRTMFTDPMFSSHLTGASSAGIVCGVYHYIMAKTCEEAVREADYVISVIELYKNLISLWVAADFEDNSVFGKMDGF